MQNTLTNDAIARLEQATLEAVAPAEQDELDAWLVPYDHSTIGRATSAVPLRHHGIESSSLREIESRYMQRGLPAAFRIADVPTLANLTRELGAMGYVATQPTLVQVGNLTAFVALNGTADDCHRWPVLVEGFPSSTWSSVYTATGFDPIDGAHRVQALSRSAHVIYATIRAQSGDGSTLAAGTASMSHDWTGFHGMRTVIAARGQGLATAILLGLARVAIARQYRDMFLQVEETNYVARSIYQRAGFLTAWRYHYWRKPLSGS